MPDDKKGWTIETWIQFAGLAAAILAILVTVFFSLRSERTKDISISVLAKRPLLSVDSASPRNGLEVKLKGAVVAAPWLVSLRVENTGGLPIEDRDIESPLRLFFQGGKPISTEIQSSSDKSIPFNTSLSEDSVIISHKLLNPGDWVGVDVLFEGEPRIPPTALARISGVNSPKLLIPKSTDTDKTKFNLLALPTPAVYGSLVLSTVLALGFCIGGVAIGYSSSKVLVLRKQTKLNRPRDEISFSNLNINPVTDTGKVLFAAIGSPPGFELLNDNSTLIRALKGTPTGLLTSLGHDVESAAETLRHELREGFKNAIARDLYLKLPSGKDRQASDQMRSLEVNSLSPYEIAEHGRNVLNEFGPTIGREAGNGDWSDVIGALMLLLFGAALAIVTSGGWRLITGQ